MTTTPQPADEAAHNGSDRIGSPPEPPDADRPDLSVILPFCNERENLPELLARLRATLEADGLSYELIFVDDGSTDDGVHVLEEAARTDGRVKILVLSRNFGQHLATSAGIDAARGRMVLWMDSDLQERPEDIPRFVAKYREGFDVVYARRKRRRQGRWRAAISHAFLWLLNRLVRLDVPADRTCMRLFSAQVAGSLRSLQERNRYMAYLMPWVGYRSAEIEIEVDPRRRGRTKYSWTRLIRLGLTGLTSFSVAPLRIAAWLSVATTTVCVAGILFVLYRYFRYGFIISGWASLIIATLVLHSLQFAVLAVIGEYLGLTYTETKHRPLYFCSRAINVASPVDTVRTLPKADVLGSRVPMPAAVDDPHGTPPLRS